MGKIIEIQSVDDPRVAVFASLTDAELRNRLDHEKGIFIAESPKVIRVALNAGFEPAALLCERKHIEGDAADIVSSCPEIPVFTGSREVLSALTGYTLTRGVLCAMRRKKMPCVNEILKDAERVAVLDGICDTTNIGAVFRSAAALGIDAVLLSSTACDPFNRRAIRVSMGTVFLIPFCFTDEYQRQLNSLEFKTVAMALRDNSVSLDDAALRREKRLAIILGTEGDGLDNRVIENADYTVKIPMHRGVDSLNVGAAAAIAFYELTKR